MMVKFGRQLGKKYHYRNLGSDIPVIVAARNRAPFLAHNPVVLQKLVRA
jgi:hypothetical protein